MNPVARVRHVLARRPWLHWTAVLALAAGAGWAVAAGVAGVDDARRSWGTTRDVLVATADIAPGDDLAARTELRTRPRPGGGRGHRRLATARGGRPPARRCRRGPGERRRRPDARSAGPDPRRVRGRRRAPRPSRRVRPSATASSPPAQAWSSPPRPWSWGSPPMPCSSPCRSTKPRSWRSPRPPATSRCCWRHDVGSSPLGGSVVACGDRRGRLAPVTADRCGSSPTRAATSTVANTPTGTSRSSSRWRRWAGAATTNSGPEEAVALVPALFVSSATAACDDDDSPAADQRRGRLRGSSRPTALGAGRVHPGPRRRATG